MIGSEVTADLAKIAPILTALLMAWIAYRQYGLNRSQLKIAQDKVRLDLYQRRFSVYERTLAFYQCLVGAANMVQGSSFEQIHRDFIKSFRESQFLFEERSGIFSLLDEMHKEAFKIIGFKTHGEDVKVHPETFTKMHQDSMTALAKLSGYIEDLEKAIAPYLDFRRVLA